MWINGKVLKILRLAAGLSREALAAGVRRLTVQRVVKIERHYNASGIGEMTAKQIAQIISGRLPMSYEQVLEAITTGSVTEDEREPSLRETLREIEERLENLERLAVMPNEVRRLGRTAVRIEGAWVIRKRGLGR